MIDCNICYDIFISYRNKGGKQVARQLHKWLSETEGYSTFYDDECLREGRWDKALLRHVKRCRDFLLIVDRHTFDRIYDESYSVEDDWVRKELSEALKMGDDVINIIPIIILQINIPKNPYRSMYNVNGFITIKLTKATIAIQRSMAKEKISGVNIKHNDPKILGIASIRENNTACFLLNDIILHAVMQIPNLLTPEMIEIA